MPEEFEPEPALLASDLESFKRQETTFVLLNLLVLASIILIHTIFASHFGNPPRTLVVVLAAGFLLNSAELIWIQGRKDAVPRAGVAALTWSAIAMNMLLAFALAALSKRQDTQYFALMVVPILEAAFRLSFIATVAVVVAADALEFFWVWSLFRSYPPPNVTEYFEVATVSLVFAIMGLLVWLLVNHLRQETARLDQSRLELERTKEKLLMEEKLAAVGRLSSAIAHEVRNPVAMISSSLATALRGDLGSEERQEMFEIAAKEASRLERLTRDFLAYARPQPPAKAPSDVADTIEYVASLCRAQAAENDVTIEVNVSPGLLADMDPGQVQRALLNLLMNAVEASAAGGRVQLFGVGQDGQVRIDVENANGAIPQETAALIFEPFFTTKPGGTGLGLAIARNVCRAHGGDLVLARNQPGAVRFSMTLPACDPAHAGNGKLRG